MRSVALYLEADGDGARWCAALETAARDAGIGVAVLKAGRSRAGAAAAQRPHRRAGRRPARLPRAVRGAGRRLGGGPARPARAAKALAARARRLATAQRVGDGGVAVMTCSGGDSAVAADLAAELGVDLPALAPATIARLEASCPRRRPRPTRSTTRRCCGTSPRSCTALIEALARRPGDRARARALRRGRSTREDWAAVLAGGREPARRRRDGRPRRCPSWSSRRARSPACAAGMPARCGRSRDTARASPTRDATAAGTDRRGRGQGAAARGRDPRRPTGESPTTPSPTWRELGGPVAVKRARRDAQGARGRRRARPRRRATRAPRAPRERRPRRAHRRSSSAMAPRGDRGARRDPPRRARPGARRRRRRRPHRGLDDVAVVPLPADAARIDRGARDAPHADPARADRAARRSRCNGPAARA